MRAPTAAVVAFRCIGMQPSIMITPQPSDESVAPTSNLKFEHTALGSFVAEDDLWVCKIPRGRDGLELSLAAMLVSPNFLYIIETSEPDPST